MGPKYIENVAMVGAGGSSGRFMVEALVKGGKHRVTAISRPDSTNTMPKGLFAVKEADYTNHSSLVEALRGQEVLVITMNVYAPKENHTRLIDAAAEAGVQWIVPNEWGIDLEREQMAKDTSIGPRLLAIREYIEKVGAGKMHWIGVACSLWYEFSLGGSAARYGFDFDNKHLTLYDDGSTKINTTTWAQVGRALASLLSLKISPDDENDTSPHLSQYRNKSVYVSSFLLSQRDMLDSVLRVTGDSEKDWTISHEDVKERFQRGLKMAQDGDPAGYVIVLYSRIFFADDACDFSDKLDNEALGLPKESLDDATKIAIQRAEAGETRMPDRKRDDRLPYKE